MLMLSLSQERDGAVVVLSEEDDLGSLWIDGLVSGNITIGNYASGSIGVQFADYINQYILFNINGDETFLQVVVARGERTVGIKYGAILQDPGCRDEQFFQHVREARAQNLSYSAERQLPACYSESLVLPTRSFWSYRWDTTTTMVLWVVFCVLLSLDCSHTLLYRYVDAQRDLNSVGWRERGWPVTRAVLRQLLQARFILLELPSWLLPLMLESPWCPAVGPLGYMNLCAAAQLIVFARAFAEAEAFPLLERLVGTFSAAAKDVLGLIIVMVLSCFSFACISLVMFGVFYPGTDVMTDQRFIELFADAFTAIIEGADLDEEMLRFNPTGTYISYFVRNLFLFLIISQIFIAVLVGAFDATAEKVDLALRDMSLPAGYIYIGEKRIECARWLLDYPVAFFTPYVLEYHAWAPTLLMALHQVIDAAEEMDEAVLHEQVLVTPAKLDRALMRAGISAGWCRKRCISCLMASHGATRGIGRRGLTRGVTRKLTRRIPDRMFKDDEGVGGGGTGGGNMDDDVAARFDRIERSLEAIMAALLPPAACDGGSNSGQSSTVRSRMLARLSKQDVDAQSNGPQSSHALDEFRNGEAGNIPPVLPFSTVPIVPTAKPCAKDMDATSTSVSVAKAEAEKALTKARDEAKAEGMWVANEDGNGRPQTKSSLKSALSFSRSRSGRKSTQDHNSEWA